MHALTRVGIAEHALKGGSELSGGQQQHASLGRWSRAPTF
jgi:phosphonate transport system ATP-binding protein